MELTASRLGSEGLAVGDDRGAAFRQSASWLGGRRRRRRGTLVELRAPIAAAIGALGWRGGFEDPQVTTGAATRANEANLPDPELSS